MERKQQSGDGQNSNDMSKDNLVPQSPSQKDPYKAKASEFSVKKVSAATGQSEDGGDQDKLVPWEGNKTAPRDAETKGGEADSMTTRAGNVAANFKVSKNGGESNTAGTDPGYGEGVDLSTGAISGGTLTPIKAVYEKSVKLGG